MIKTQDVENLFRQRLRLTLFFFLTLNLFVIFFTGGMNQLDDVELSTNIIKIVLNHSKTNIGFIFSILINSYFLNFIHNFQ